MEFDRATGNFIVTIRMTLNQYAKFAQHQRIADLNKMKFDKESGDFFVPVYLTPTEYGDYVKDQVLPVR